MEAQVQPTPAAPPHAEEPPSEAEEKPRPSSTLGRDNAFVFTTTWVAGVLAAAASIVFGIWAPLSYKATADGNRDNNAVQSTMMASLSVANSIAAAALSTASAQSQLLGDTQSQLGAMGQLMLVNFCASNTAAESCSSFLANVPFTSMVSYLASSSIASGTLSTIPLPTVAPSTGSSLPGSPSPTGAAGPPESPAGPSSIPVAAIMGIVFGVVGVGGLALGVVVWRYRRRRGVQDGSDY